MIYYVYFDPYRRPKMAIQFLDDTLTETLLRITSYGNGNENG